MERKNDLKKKVYFFYNLDQESENNWRDGLWSALQLLKQDYDIYLYNFATQGPILPSQVPQDADAVLGWGAFETDMDRFMREILKPKGLLIGGYCYQPSRISAYDVLFYETKWYADAELSQHKNTFHAFGVNTDIFVPNLKLTPFIDYLTIGAFASWKRQLLIAKKPGLKIAVGHIQTQDKEAMKESQQIIAQLLMYDVGIMPQVSPEVLADFYNVAQCVYIPADVAGGGERAILEARACGRPVEIMDDNPKLLELTTCPVYDQHYYYKQLKKGLESIL